MTSQANSAEKGGGIVKKALAASLLTAALALPALVVPASAADVVREGRTIEAFIGSDLVNVQNYPANRPVTVEVVRNGVVVSSVNGRTDRTGFAEFNHGGGGQFPNGDCFKPPVSPDVIPGDVIRAKVASERSFDRAVVRDVFLDTDATQIIGNEIHVFGHVRDVSGGTVDKAADVLELRLNANGFTWDVTQDPEVPTDEGRRDLRGQVSATEIQPDGTFEHVFTVSGDDAVNASNNGFEQAFEWSAAAPPGAEEEVSPPAIFVSDEVGGEALVGCPPAAENAVTDSNPDVINKANLANGLVLSGISKNAATTVSVTLDDQDASNADQITLNATPRTAYVDSLNDTFQTWSTAKVTAAQLRTMGDGRLTASIGQGPDLRILKDTIAPRNAPTATPEPGVYPRTQRVTLDTGRGNEIHYTLNGSRPTANSPVFTRPLKVASTRTIKAIAVDRAGNTGPAKAYRYVIR